MATARRRASGGPSQSASGSKTCSRTTLVAIALVTTDGVDAADDGDDEEVAWVNVGDSRVYLLRDGELTQLSRDHSLVEDLRRGGQLSEEEAAVHPQRNILTRALGIDTDVEVDSGAVLPFLGDRFLLCSDGIHQPSPAAVLGAALEASTPGRAVGLLVEFVMRGPARDNLSAVVVRQMPSGGRS